MPSKEVIDREKSAREVVAAGETHGVAVAAALGELLTPLLKRGEKMPDIALLVALMGRRLEATSEALVKAANRAPLGVIAVDPLLAAHGEDRLRALAWYAHEKSVRLDASLLWRRAFGAF